MEKWKEILVGQIPCEKYYVNIENGDKNGLTVELVGMHSLVTLKFGLVSALSMIDEDMLLLGGYIDADAIRDYKYHGFSNVIYQVEDGYFGNLIRKNSGDMYEAYKLRHFAIVTMNYVIDIIASEEPEITVLKQG